MLGFAQLFVAVNLHCITVNLWSQAFMSSKWGWCYIRGWF